MGLSKDGGGSNSPKYNTKSPTTYDAFWLGNTPHNHRVTFNQVCALIAWRGRVESKKPLAKDEKLNLELYQSPAYRHNEF